MLIHGHTRNGTDTPEYRSWRAMMGRCYTKTDKKYPRYGGMGIIVCPRWHSFENFLADMGLRPAGCTIDRIDRLGNYELANCRWATPEQQSRNRKTARTVVLEGQRFCLRDIIDERGLNYQTIKSRLKRGWTAEEAVQTPLLRPPTRGSG